MDDAGPLMHADWIRYFQQLEKAIQSPTAINYQQLTMPTGRLLGRTSAGTGPVEPIAVSGPLTLAAGALGITGSGLTRVNDTNVTATLTGTPATALLASVEITLGWTGTLGLSRGGTNANLSATGGASQVLKQSSVGAAVTVGVLAGSDITGAALTKVDDTNVTAVLSANAPTALLRATSITLGWNGTLAVARGGIGVGTLASNGVLYGNGTGAVQALAVNASATQKFLSQVSSGAPVWAEVASGGTVRGEVPAGAINGVNTVYTTSADYGDDLAVYRNGVRQLLTTDYTETTATTFTFVTAPLTGDLLQVDYSEAGGGGGAGALVLLEELIASASTDLQVLTAITSTYDEYLIEFVNLLPTTDGDSCQLTVSSDGGSSWQATNYQYCFRYFSPAGAAGVVNSTVDTSLFLLNNVRNSTDGMSGSLRLFNPLGALSKLLIGNVAGLETDANRYWFDGAWWFVSATAINALRVKYSTSTIASGAVRVYGVAKA